MRQPAEHVPEEIASALEPDESVEAGFDMGAGLEIFATGKRLFGRRGGRVIHIQYAEISDAKRQASDWRTWRGITRIALGLGFIAAGALTGFEGLGGMTVGAVLLLIGGSFVMLGLYRRDDWVELKVEREQPPPSFWYLVVFLPYWLLLRSRTRYSVPGRREAVDAFYQFLTARLRAEGKVAP